MSELIIFRLNVWQLWKFIFDVRFVLRDCRLLSGVITIPFFNTRARIHQPFFRTFFNLSLVLQGFFFFLCLAAFEYNTTSKVVLHSNDAKYRRKRQRTFLRMVGEYRPGYLLKQPFLEIFLV